MTSPPPDRDDGAEAPGAPPASPFEDERASKPLALQLELPAAMPAPASPSAEERASFAGHARRHLGRALALGGVAIAAVVAAGVWLLPRYVRRACVQQAADHGIVLAIDDVSIRSSGFVLHGVTASLDDLPDARIEVPAIIVQTRGFTPDKLTASEMEIAVRGRWARIDAALERWRAKEEAGSGGGWAPSSIVLDGSRLVWSGALGDQVRVEAAGLHFDVAWTGPTPVVHATSSLVTLVVPAGTLGPWRVDLDREPGLARARVALDPAVPETSTLLLVGDDEAATAADIAIPRSPLGRLGVSPSLVGLKGQPQVAVDLHWVPFNARAAAVATSHGGVYGVTLDGIPQPLDITWDLRASGEAGVADLKQSKVSVGPLVGPVKGTLKTYPDGFRVDAAWSAGPVPCAALDPPAGGEGAPLDFAYQIRKLAQSAGLTKLTGTVSASATLTFDSRDIGATTLSFTPTSTCDLSMGK